MASILCMILCGVTTFVTPHSPSRSSSATIHAYLDRGAAISFLHKWKPQVVGESLVSVTGVDSYTRARIALECDLSSGVLVGESMDTFVASFAQKNRTKIIAVLWSSPDAPKIERFRALRVWHYNNFPSLSMDGSSINDDDHDPWQTSAYNP